MPQTELNAQLAKAFGLGKARRMMLTLEAGQLPTIEVETYLTDEKGAVLLEVEPSGIGQRIASIAFKLRLEPFTD